MPAAPTVLVAVPGLSGGVDEAARHLFGSEEFRRRWQVMTLTTKGPRNPIAPLVFAAALIRLAVLAIGGRIDLVHLNVSSRGSALRKLVVGSLARLLGVPYVIQLHGGGFERFHRGLPAVGQAVIRWFFRGAQHVFVLGEPFADLARTAIGVDAERVSIARNAVSVPPAPAALITGDGASPPGDDQVPMVLFTGRLGSGKGIPELLEALGRQADLPWRAVLAGDGDVDGTRARVSELGLADRVEVRGWQGREQVSELLEQASVFVLPSHLEALSVSLLEAMAQGLCCIATPVGAQGEILEHEDNALVVAPGDVEELTEAIGRALTDASLRRTLGRAARETVSASCSNAVVVEQLSTVYERILAAA